MSAKDKVIGTLFIMLGLGVMVFGGMIMYKDRVAQIYTEPETTIYKETTNTTKNQNLVDNVTNSTNNTDNTNNTNNTNVLNGTETNSTDSSDSQEITVNNGTGTKYIY